MHVNSSLHLFHRIRDLYRPVRSVHTAFWLEEIAPDNPLPKQQQEQISDCGHARNGGSYPDSFHDEGGQGDHRCGGWPDTVEQVHEEDASQLRGEWSEEIFPPPGVLRCEWPSSQ